MNLPVMRATGMGREKIETDAQKLLRDFCPEATTEMIRLPIEKMFEQYLPKKFNIETSYDELSFGIHGYTDPNKLKSCVEIKLIDSNEVSTLRFGRSTIGHEIGHAILHAHQFKRKNLATKFLHDGTHKSELFFRQDQLPAYENPEWQAWEMCKSLFIPKHLLMLEIEKGITVRELSNRLDLNPAFIVERLKNLRLQNAVKAY